MGAEYLRVAGKNVDRLAALSDGVFAFAMTLLVLDLRVPPVEHVHSEGDLLGALAALGPRAVTVVLSFLTLGIFWVGQQAQLNLLERTDQRLTWIHLAFLLAVTAVPFSTALLGTFIGYRTALITYWLVILLLGLVLLAAWTYTEHAGLVKDEVEPSVRQAVRRRIVLAQALYAVGAALCVPGTAWSITFIYLLQLNYALAPRIRPLSRL
ncbi:MAG TPA: TMEM175 family protein [Candidatus Sulfotelmatobacter sp.]|nr:TMEM175 family protein [Candidatus Sulfotelmatobacter sp.]